jgi:predicted membrane GTPase involved in stress response
MALRGASCSTVTTNKWIAGELTLEGALEYIEEDELVEVTPDKIRLRKILLSEHDRRKDSRKKAAVMA